MSRFTTHTRVRLAAAAALASLISGSGSASAQESYGPWSRWNTQNAPTLVLYVSPGGSGIQNGSSPTNAMATIGAAITAAEQAQAMGAPRVTINVQPGTYSAENFPLQVPSQRVAIEACPVVGGVVPATIDLPSGAGTAVVIQANSNFPFDPDSPWSEVRGITFPLEENQTAIRIAAGGFPAVGEQGVFQPARVLVQDCTFLTNGARNTRGVVVQPQGSSAVVSEARIVSNVFDASPGSPTSIAIEDRGLGAEFVSSTLILANKICGWRDGVRSMSEEDAQMRPRIQSNVVQQCTTGLDLIRVRSLVVGNTVANGDWAGGGATVIQGIAIAGGSHEISNNIIWNLPRGSSGAIDFQWSGGTASGVANTYRSPALFDQVANLGITPVFLGWDPRTAGGPTNGCADLHLDAAVATVQGLGDLTVLGAGPTAFQVVPVPNGLPPVLGTVWNVRRDLAIDFEDDPRVTNRAGLVSDVGADQVHELRLAPGASSTPAPIDEFGNLLAASGTPTSTNTFTTSLVLTGAPANTAVVLYLGFSFFDGLAGLDNGFLYQNTLTGAGSFRLGLSAAESLTLPLLTTGSTPLAIPLPLGGWGPSLCQEVEIYAQAVAFANGQLSTTNRQRIELNWQ